MHAHAATSSASTPPANSRQVWLVLSLFHLLVLGGLVVCLVLGLLTARREMPLLGAVQKLEQDVILTHLWLEELLAGDRDVRQEDVWAHLGRAGNTLQAMLHGGRADDGMDVPTLADPALRRMALVVEKDFTRLQVRVRDRLAEGQPAGSPADAEFDAHVQALLKDITALESSLRHTVSLRTGRFELAGHLALGLTLLLWLATTLLSLRARRLAARRLEQVQEARQEAESRRQMLAITLRSMDDGVVTTDAAGLVSSINPAAEILTGWPADEALGTSADAVVVTFEDADDGARVFPVVTVMDSRQSFSPAASAGILRLKTRNGTVRPVILAASPMLDDAGEPRGVVLVFKDVGEQKKAEERALAASKAKSEFLANMSHELRTPISGIMGMTELALQAETDPRKRENLTLIKRSAQTLLHIINDILDLSKVESGKIALVRERFSLGAIMDGVLRSFAIQAMEKGLTLSSHVDEACPDNLVGDPYRLEQVLRNLLSNAIKFTPNGEVEVRVALESCGASQALVRFTVRDSGIGIPRERMTDLFRSFTQLDASYSKRFAGTGLGLAISKEMVEAMGGRIWAESVHGQGSTFGFNLPLDLAPAARDQGDAPPAAVRLPCLRVLVAEDDLTNRIYIEHLLREAGHKATLVENGREVLEALRRGSYDLILMDVQMPDMGGLEATRRIRQASPEEMDPQVPIVALTAYAMRGDRETFLAGGMDGYLTKPLDPDDFTVEVIKAFRNRQRSLEESFC